MLLKLNKCLIVKNNRVSDWEWSLKSNITDICLVRKEDTKAGTVNAIKLFAAKRRRRRLNQQLLSVALLLLKCYSSVCSKSFHLYFTSFIQFSDTKFKNRQRTPALLGQLVQEGESGVALARNMNPTNWFQTWGRC